MWVRSILNGKSPWLETEQVPKGSCENSKEGSTNITRMRCVEETSRETEKDLQASGDYVGEEAKMGERRASSMVTGISIEGTLK